MAENSHLEISADAVYENFSEYLFGSAGDETEEIKKDDENENTDQTEVTVVEERVIMSDVHEPESLSLEQLANSDFIRDRQLAAKSIVEYLHQAGSNKEALHSVISIMCKLSDDGDLMVRSELMEHIPSIALFCKEHSEDLGVVIRQQIVPYTVKLLTDIQKQVRKIGHTTLLVLLENDVIDNSQLTEWICPLIAQLATSESTPEELRVEDVSVMCKMIPYVGKEITEKFFLEPILSLCHDSSSSVREVCTANFGNISKVLGVETTESMLLSAFLDLCQDKAQEIKVKCIDIAVDLASVVSPTTRNEILSDVYMTFLNSRSRGIWFTAYRSLGRFIAAFADPSKTGLSYINGKWLDIPVEDKSIEDQQKMENYFELLTSELVSNPQFLDECSFLDEVLNGYLPDCNSTDEELPQMLSYSVKNNISNRDICNYDRISHHNVEMSEFRIEMSGLSLINCQKRTITNLLTKDEHLYHVDNENVFNNFQFWRTPLPEVEVDIDECNSTQINSTTSIHNEDSSDSCTPELNRIPQQQGSEEPDSILQNTETDINVCKSIENNLSEDSPKCYPVPKSKPSYIKTLDKSGMIVFYPYPGTTEPTTKEKRNLQQIEPTTKEKLLQKERLKNRVSKKDLTTEKERLVYEQDILPPTLLLEFINNMCYEEEIREKCAFYFPSVAFTIGGKYWLCLRDLFNVLATDVKCNIRKTIASCLHELATVLGPDITTEDLLPVFLDMLRDPNVRYHSSLLMNISQFLKKLNPNARREFLPLIQGITTWDDEDSNWRYRLTIAEQFIPCVELFSSSEALHFLPVSLLLLQDKVSAVRSSAVELLAVIIKSMVTNSKSSEFLKAALCALDEKYRKANKWLWRQMYVYICQELAVKKSLPTEYYVNEIVPNLFSLAWDTVPNVRLAVARCLGLTLLPLDFFPSIQKAHYQLLLQVMYSLQSDVDRDVRYFAHLSAAAFNVLPPEKLSPA